MMGRHTLYGSNAIFAIACACTTHVLTITKMCSRIRALHDRPTLLKNEKLQPQSSSHFSTSGWIFTGVRTTAEFYVNQYNMVNLLTHLRTLFF